MFKPIIITSAVALLWALSLVGPLTVWADSLLSPPIVDTTLYSIEPGKLSSLQRAKIKVHGIRNASLQSDVWGPLRTERTENSRLIPIKRFFLRASEYPDFLPSKIVLSFAFAKTGGKNIKQLSNHDPMVEVGFGGEVRVRSVNDPGKDVGYAARFSASPYLQSGLFYHTGGSYILVDDFKDYKVKMGRFHSVEIGFKDERIDISIDGTPLTSYRSADASKGLIHLIGGWHPVQIEKLLIEGTHRGGKAPAKSVTYSGLFSLPKRHD